MFTYLYSAYCCIQCCTADEAGTLYTIYHLFLNLFLPYLAEFDA